MRRSRYPYGPGVSEKFGMTPLMTDYDMKDTYVDYDLFYI